MLSDLEEYFVIGLKRVVLVSEIALRDEPLSTFVDVAPYKGEERTMAKR